MAQSYISWRVGRITSKAWEVFKDIFPILIALIVLVILGGSVKSCIHEDGVRRAARDKADAAAANEAKIAAAHAQAVHAQIAQVAAIAPAPPPPQVAAQAPPVPAPSPSSARLAFVEADALPDGVQGDVDVIAIDQDTGCQYIMFRDGRLSGQGNAVIPRLHIGADGKPEPYCKPR